MRSKQPQAIELGTSHSITNPNPSHRLLSLTLALTLTPTLTRLLSLTLALTLTPTLTRLAVSGCPSLR